MTIDIKQLFGVHVYDGCPNFTDFTRAVELLDAMPFPRRPKRTRDRFSSASLAHKYSEEDAFNTEMMTPELHAKEKARERIRHINQCFDRKFDAEAHDPYEILRDASIAMILDGDLERAFEQYCTRRFGKDHGLELVFSFGEMQNEMFLVAKDCHFLVFHQSDLMDDSMEDDVEIFTPSHQPSAEQIQNMLELARDLFCNPEANARWFTVVSAIQLH